MKKVIDNFFTILIPAYTLPGISVKSARALVGSVRGRGDRHGGPRRLPLVSQTRQVISSAYKGSRSGAEPLFWPFQDETLGFVRALKRSIQNR